MTDHDPYNDRPTPGAKHLDYARERYARATDPHTVGDISEQAALAQAAALIAISEQLQHIAQSLHSIDVSR